MYQFIPNSREIEQLNSFHWVYSFRDVLSKIPRNCLRFQKMFEAFRGNLTDTVPSVPLCLCSFKLQYSPLVAKLFLTNSVMKIEKPGTKIAVMGSDENNCPALLILLSE